MGTPRSQEESARQSHQVPPILNNLCVVSSIRAHTKSTNRLLEFRIYVASSIKAHNKFRMYFLVPSTKGPQQVPHVHPGPFYYYPPLRPSAVSLLDPAKD